MLKRILELAFGLALLCGLGWTEALYRTVAVTATSQTIPFGDVGKVTILNDGANEVYFRLFYSTEAPAAASTAVPPNVYLAPGAALEYGRPQGYGAISLVCDGAETTTVRLYFQ